MTDWILDGKMLPAAMLMLWTVMAATAMRSRPMTAWWTELPAALAVGGAMGLVAFALIVLGPAGGAEGSAWLARVCASVAVTAAAYAWPVLALRRARLRVQDDWVIDGAQLAPRTQTDTSRS